VLLLAVVGAYFAIQRSDVQNWLAQKVTSKISEKLGTKVSVDNIQIDFLNHVNLRGFFAEDQQKDTLLYAGNLQLKFTDWFFLNNQKPVVSYLALEDAYVNINRGEDSATHPWNFQYIIDKLASGGNAKPKTAQNDTAKSDPFELDVKLVKLNRVRINSIDKWQGQNLVANVGALELDAQNIDVKQKLIDIAAINISDTKFNYADYQGGKPRKKKDSIDNTPFNPDLWTLKVGDLNVEKTFFTYDHNFDKPRVGMFDEQHIAVSDINIGIKGISVVGDTLDADIKKFYAKERCGLQIKSLRAHTKLSPVRTTLSNIELVTNNSRISDNYEMIYSRFPDFQHYIDRVIMKASFENCSIAMSDLAYFAPTLRDLTVKQVTLKRGTFFGTVRDFQADKVDLLVGNSRLDGNLRMKGLPDIEKTYITMQAKQLSTSGNELVKLVPQAKTDAVAWNNLSSIKFSGDYTGYIRDFKVNGTLRTNQGDVVSNLHLKFPKEKGAQPSYEGYFNTSNLKLGAIVKQDAIGTISADGNIKGEGFDLENLNSYFNGKVRYIETKQYNFRDIAVNGTFKNKKFDGKINANDPNLAMNFEGALDLSQKVPHYKLRTELTRFNLKELGLTKQNISGAAKMDLNFTATNIDDFLGNAKLTKLKLNDGKHVIELDSAILTSSQDNGIRTLNLASDAADARIAGKFNIAQLPNAMQFYMANYLPSYIDKPRIQGQQQFDFTLVTKNIEPLLETFVPKLSGCNNAHIAGTLDMPQQFLHATVKAPSVMYDGIYVNSIDIQSDGNYDTLVTSGTTGVFAVDGKEIIPNSNFKTILQHDSGYVTLLTSGGTYEVRDAKIVAKGYALDGKLFVGIEPSEFYAIDQKWHLRSTDDIIINGSQIQIQDVYVENGLQQLIVNTRGANNENLEVAFQNLDLTATQYFNKATDLTGRASGTFFINKYQTERVYSGNISTTNINLNGELVGKLKAEAEYDEANKKIILKPNSGIEYEGNYTSLYGEVDVSQEDALLDLHAKLDNTNLRIAESFLNEFISNTEGRANGNIDIKGPVSNYDVDGNVTISDAKTKVNYLGTTYYIDNAKVKLNEGVIDFGESILYDAPRDAAGTRNEAKITIGKVTHDHFADLGFDIILVSERFQFLNTTANDNSDYYGPVIADGSLVISGPIDNLNLSLIGTTLKGTHLHIPVTDEYDNGTYDFITFTQFGDSLTNSDNSNARAATKEKILKVELIVAVTPEAEISIILDNRTKEMIYGRGEGYLRINIDLGKEFTMDGTITTKDSSYYDYKFRGLTAKRIDILPGGTISWSGDPLKASLNLDASYKVPNKLSIAPLITSETEKANATQEYPTYVNIHLAGYMLNPEITYDILQPDNTDRTNAANAKLMELRRNEQEMIAQVGSLLLADQFFPSNANVDASSITTSLINNFGSTLTPTLSNLINNGMSRVLGSNIGRINIKYNNQATQLSSGSLLTNSNDNLSISYAQGFWNDRVQLEFDQKITYNRTKNDINWHPTNTDFKLQYLVRRDGRLRASVFGNNIASATTKTGQEYRFGASLLYRRNYNSLYEMFGRNEPYAVDKILDSSSLLLAPFDSARGTN
jgi:hypothetical protein